MSLAELVDRGEHDDHPHAPSDHATAGPLQWLGLAVGELPYLASSARTVDDLNWSSRAPNGMRMNLRFVDGLTQQIASSASLVHRALLAHIARHPQQGDPVAAMADVDLLSQALVEEHPPLSRRADLLMGSYATALAAAVQASGYHYDAKLAAAAAAGEPAGPDADACADVVADALVRALATLLGHARLNARDSDYVGRRTAEEAPEFVRSPAPPARFG
jgi:hypothetical protein